MAVVLLFDGVCNLCNFWVKFALNNSQENKVYFASLQSQAGAKLLIEGKMDKDYSQSLVLIEKGVYYTQSTAVMRLCAYLKWYWRVAFVLYVFPKFMRDFIYKWIAKNRYVWWGKQPTCMVPRAEWKSRFIESEMDLNLIGMEK